MGDPIFVVGSQRSGTTLLRLMLNAHPNIAIPFESNFIVDTARRIDEYGDLRDRKNLRRLLDDIAEDSFVARGGLIVDKEKILAFSPDTYPELIRSIYTVYAASHGKTRWGDKDPAYVTDLDVIHELFPDCRIIHIVRDGRDVASSLMGLDWGSRNIPRLARDWQWKVTLAHKMGAMIPDQYLEVRYEDLVRSPQACLEEICDFVGERYDDAMLRYHEEASKSMPSDSLKYHASSISPPDPAKIQMWKSKMTPSDQMIYEQIAGETLNDFGYEGIHGRVTLAAKIRHLQYTLFRRW